MSSFCSDHNTHTLHKKRNVYNKVPNSIKKLKQIIWLFYYKKSHSRSTRVEYTGHNDAKYA